MHTYTDKYIKTERQADTQTHIYTLNILNNFGTEGHRFSMVKSYVDSTQSHFSDSAHFDALSGSRARVHVEVTIYGFVNRCVDLTTSSGNTVLKVF